MINKEKISKQGKNSIIKSVELASKWKNERKGYEPLRSFFIYMDIFILIKEFKL